MAISQELVELDAKVDALKARVDALPKGVSLSDEDKAAIAAIGVKVDGIAAPSA